MSPVRALVGTGTTVGSGASITKQRRSTVIDSNGFVNSGSVAGFTDVDTFIDIHGLRVNTQLTVIRHNDPAAAVIRKYDCEQGLGEVY